MTDIVDKTWDELGYKIKAAGYKVWVRCDEHARQSKGGIWLSPKAQGFHGVLPHMQTIYGTVLSAGELGVAKQFKPGDRVMFKRLHLGWWSKLGKPRNDDPFGEAVVGFIDANEILGRPVEDAA